MKSSFALYLKELKDNRNLFLFLLIGTVALDLWVLLTVETQVFAVALCGLPVWAFMFILPFMLASSFSSEWKSNTNHLMLSLPIRTSMVGLCKFLAILSMGTVLFTVVVVAVYLVMSRSSEPVLQQVPNVFGFTSSEAFEYVVGIYFSYLFLLLGIVGGMEGVKFTVKRFRGLAAFGFFLAGLFFYKWFMGYFFDALRGSMGDGLILTVYSILAGLVFLALGLFLFEKYVET